MTEHVVDCCLDVHLGCLQGYLGNWIRIAGVWDFMLEYGACILDYGQYCWCVATQQIQDTCNDNELRLISSPANQPTSQAANPINQASQ